MELYIVIAKLVANTTDKYQDHRILKRDEPIPDGFTKISDPTSLDACVNYIREENASHPNWFGLTVAQYVLIGIVTLVFLGVVGMGAWKLQGFETQDPNNVLYTSDDGARILITFLVAVTTVAIAFLAILTAMLVREFKERFALAKEVLTILVGILGTIIGFYFGTASKPNPGQSANGNVNGNIKVNSNINTNTNTNSNRAAPSAMPKGEGNANSVSLNQGLRLRNGLELATPVEKGGKWKITV